MMGTICPGGKKVGDRKSSDQMGPGPNASKPLNDRYLTRIILLSSLNLGWWYVIVHQNWRCHCGIFSLIEWIFRILIQVLFQDSAHNDF